MTSGIGVDDVTVMMTNVIAVRFCFTKMKELMKKKEMRMKMKRSEDACSQLIQVSHLLKKLTIEQIKMMKLNRESFTNSLKQSNHHFVDLDSFINKIFRPESTSKEHLEVSKSEQILRVPSLHAIKSCETDPGASFASHRTQVSTNQFQPSPLLTTREKMKVQKSSVVEKKSGPQTRFSMIGKVEEDEDDDEDDA